MLKMFQKHIHRGSSVELWEENWRSVKLNLGLQFCRIDPLRPLFTKYAKSGSLMLEGGCGVGQYVTFYTHKGVKVIGIDFAQKALKRLNSEVSGLMLCAGNVAALPFQDESFDVYYSGGVVEHFESGADDSLFEAYRVLKKDGVLLISVPYFSPLRRMLLPFKKDVWRSVDKSETEIKTENGLKFFQYAYRPGEFSKKLEEAGFEIVKKQGFAVLWGLSEINLKGGKSEIETSPNKSEPIAENVDLSIINQEVSAGLLKRLVVSEDDTIPILGLGVKFMRWFSANMMMYVCVRR